MPESPEDLHDAVWAKLDGIAHLTTYDADVPENPPTDANGRVEAYAVLFASPGRLYASALDGVQGSRDSTFQVTCGGGDPTYVFNAIAKVQAGLIGPLTVGQGPGARTYDIRAREDVDPGPIRKDETKTKPRFFLPLQFRLHVP